MAGHYPLSPDREPKIFEKVTSMRKKVISMCRLLGNFNKGQFSFKGINYEVMKLSNDYCELPESQIACSLGNFSLQDEEMIAEQHESIIKNISLECHFDKRTGDLIAIYWVA